MADTQALQKKTSLIHLDELRVPHEIAIDFLKAIGTAEVLKQLKLTETQRDFLAKEFYRREFTVEEIIYAAEFVVNKETFQSIAFNHWKDGVDELRRKKSREEFNKFVNANTR